jgi:hypothetical protein
MHLEWSGPNILRARVDEFVPLALHDPDGHTNLRKILRGVVRLRPLHQADIFHEVLELFWCS